MNDLIIVGAGGHGKAVYDIAVETKRFRSIYFVDDKIVGDFYKSKIIGSIERLDDYIGRFVFIVAIGCNKARQNICREILAKDGKLVSIVSSFARLSESAKIGKGSVVMPMAVVNSDSILGDGVILNTASVVEHDCFINDFCHISPNATICGTVNVGSRTWIGAGATVINNLGICDDVVVGANSTVARDINVHGVYKGLVR